MTEKLSTRQASEDDLPKLRQFTQDLGTVKNDSYYERCLQRQQQGDLILFIADIGGVDVAYGVLNWKPKYPLYRRLGIPEIQDLNVHPDWRRQGIATRFIAYCEGLARAEGFGQIGIGVSVHASFGPAQILYAKLGYVPDGQGVSYDRQGVEFGALKAVDDQLCLMMVKDLD